MRKILVIGLVLLLLLGACAGSDETPQPIPLPAATAIWQERTSVRFAIYGGLLHWYAAELPMGWRHLGPPTAISVQVILYDKDAFDRAG